jgi:lipoate-protein ligase A
VLQGPGCLNYSLILRIDGPGLDLMTIPAANCQIMNRQCAALEKVLGRKVEVKGHTDLAVGNLKFSGNAQRRRRAFLIFHGTFLLGLNLELVEAMLRRPPREPDYRLGRGHREFLTNLGIESHPIKSALREIWEAGEPLKEIPEIQPLARAKYSTDEWNFKF